MTSDGGKHGAVRMARRMPEAVPVTQMISPARVSLRLPAARKHAHSTEISHDRAGAPYHGARVTASHARSETAGTAKPVRLIGAQDVIVTPERREGIRPADIKVRSDPPPDQRVRLGSGVPNGSRRVASPLPLSYTPHQAARLAKALKEPHSHRASRPKMVSGGQKHPNSPHDHSRMLSRAIRHGTPGSRSREPGIGGAILVSTTGQVPQTTAGVPTALKAQSRRDTTAKTAQQRQQPQHEKRLTHNRPHRGREEYRRYDSESDGYEEHKDSGEHTATVAAPLTALTALQALSKASGQALPASLQAERPTPKVSVQAPMVTATPITPLTPTIMSPPATRPSTGWQLPPPRRRRSPDVFNGLDETVGGTPRPQATIPSAEPSPALPATQRYTKTTTHAGSSGLRGAADAAAIALREASALLQRPNSHQQSSLHKPYEKPSNDRLTEVDKLGYGNASDALNGSGESCRVDESLPDALSAAMALTQSHHSSLHQQRSTAPIQESSSNVHAVDAAAVASALLKHQRADTAAVASALLKHQRADTADADAIPVSNTETALSSSLLVTPLKPNHQSGSTHRQTAKLVQGPQTRDPFSMPIPSALAKQLDEQQAASTAPTSPDLSPSSSSSSSSVVSAAHPLKPPHHHHHQHPSQMFSHKTSHHHPSTASRRAAPAPKRRINSRRSNSARPEGAGRWSRVRRDCTAGTSLSRLDKTPHVQTTGSPSSASVRSITTSASQYGRPNVDWLAGGAPIKTVQNSASAPSSPGRAVSASRVSSRSFHTRRRQSGSYAALYGVTRNHRRASISASVAKSSTGSVGSQGDGRGGGGGGYASKFAFIRNGSRAASHGSTSDVAAIQDGESNNDLGDADAMVKAFFGTNPNSNNKHGDADDDDHDSLPSSHGLELSQHADVPQGRITASGRKHSVTTQADVVVQHRSSAHPTATYAAGVGLGNRRSRSAVVLPRASVLSGHTIRGDRGIGSGYAAIHRSNSSLRNRPFNQHPVSHEDTADQDVTAAGSDDDDNTESSSQSPLNQSADSSAKPPALLSTVRRHDMTTIPQEQEDRIDSALSKASIAADTCALGPPATANPTTTQAELDDASPITKHGQDTFPSDPDGQHRAPSSSANIGDQHSPVADAMRDGQRVRLSLSHNANDGGGGLRIVGADGGGGLRVVGADAGGNSPSSNTPQTPMYGGTGFGQDDDSDNDADDDDDGSSSGSSRDNRSAAVNDATRRHDTSRLRAMSSRASAGSNAFGVDEDGAFLSGDTAPSVPDEEDQEQGIDVQDQRQSDHDGAVGALNSSQSSLALSEGSASQPGSLSVSDRLQAGETQEAPHMTIDGEDTVVPVAARARQNRSCWRCCFGHHETPPASRPRPISNRV